MEESEVVTLGQAYSLLEVASMTLPLFPSYREIPLTQGQVALIDEEDFERISAHKWQAMKSNTTGTYYAVRRFWKGGGKYGTVLMHREILGLESGDGRIGDHILIEGTLDNRRSNLRIASPSQSNANRRLPSHNTSGTKGVRQKKNGKFEALATWKWKQHYLGCHDTIEAATKAVNDFITDQHGEFAQRSIA